MNFPFSVNAALPNDITVITADSLRTGPKIARVLRSREHVFRNPRSIHEDQSEILDKMGIASAAVGDSCTPNSQAQKLKAPITSGVKLLGSDHRAYVMKDAQSNEFVHAATLA